MKVYWLRQTRASRVEWPLAERPTARRLLAEAPPC